MSRNQSKRPTHAVYMVEDEGAKPFWTKIGAAWPHEDGEGYNVQLSAVPIGGRLVIRKAKPKTEQQGEQEAGA